VVLGSGEAGKSIAWHLGGTGNPRRVVEQRYVGGSCPNIACLPSKNIIQGKHRSYCSHERALGTRVARNVFDAGNSGPQADDGGRPDPNAI